MTPADILRKTKSIMQERGRCRHVLEDAAGHVCLAGAFNVATRGTATDYVRVTDEQRDVRRKAWEFLCIHHVNPTSFNDKESTTDEQVFAHLDAAILAAETAEGATL